MEYIYKTPEYLESEANDFCPGCMIGIVVRLIAELIEEMNISDVQILSLGIPCPEEAEGWGSFSIKPPPFASSAMSASIKRLTPEKTVIIFQGEAGNAAMGVSDTIHTANRGDSVTVISVNTLVSDTQAPSFGIPTGMSSFGGFQGMQAPAMGFQATQKPGMKTANLVASLPKPRFVARVSVHNPEDIKKAKEAIKKGLETQINNQGYSFIEILAPCHVNLDKNSTDISDYTEENILKDYPLGILKSI